MPPTSQGQWVEFRGWGSDTSFRAAASDSVVPAAPGFGALIWELPKIRGT